MRQMHPPEPEVSDGTHAQMLHAAKAKSAFGRADCRTDFCKMQRAVVVSRYHCVHERLFQRPRRLVLRKDIGRAPCEFFTGLVQFQQSRHYLMRGSKILCDRRFDQIATDKGIACGCKVIPRH